MRFLLPLMMLVTAAPMSVAQSFDAIGKEVESAIARQECPGAVVGVMHRGKVVFLKAFGQRAVQPAGEPMTVDTIFDLASLTKPIATATSVWSLIEDGKLKLDEKVATYWTEFATNGKDKLTLAHLLLHTSGLIADNPIADYADGPAKSLERICQLKPLAGPGERFIYSDVNFIVLGELVRRASGKPLDQYARERFFVPLGMADTGYRPDAKLRDRVAPTEKRKSEWIRGDVHDPRAFALGGVAGHAGLFSTAGDVLRFAGMLLNEGQVDGKTLLRPETIRAMTAAHPVPGGQRTYGWDARTGFSSNRGEVMGGFGHTGFTGTSIWVDPARQLAVVFLSNAVHPDGKGKVKALRGKVATLAAEAVLGPAAAKEPAVVMTGIDVLKKESFARLRGKKVGIVTNHTGRDRTGVPTIDLLHRAEGVTLVALFSPEHGIRGSLDQEKIQDSKDEVTGLPVYSLYGPRRKPTPEILKGIDTIVYDIQDIGCRFYTYISTLGLVMEACAENKIRLIVLDRPNPINGVDVAGPITDAGKSTFVAFHSIPLRHGMTIGELARMFQTERTPGVELDVVKCEGWRRGDYFDATGLPWVNPSPNMRTPAQANLYPGVGILETTNISVGRGTETPFEWIGAPWMDGVKVVAELHRQSVPGFTYTPMSRTPASSVHANKLCGGVHIAILDRQKADPIRLGLTLIDTLRTLYPDQWDPKRIDTLLVHKSTYQMIMDKKPVAPLADQWSIQAGAFHDRRRPFLLYE
ncbi:MAG: DUF1343 domain-containing protein [Gemmataceae bacterium]|nr:DUF1343 domain-containing protein [Gemmataceae bacterium]